MKGGTVILVVLSFWGAGLGAAPAASAGGLRIQALISPGGSGRLVVNHGEAPWIWEACRQDRSSCVPFGRGQEIETRGAPKGTVFRVESHGATGFSPEWRGRLTSVQKPTVVGAIRANEFVNPLPGQWRGGWKGEGSEMQLAACTSVATGDCITLTNPAYLRSCGTDSSFALHEEFVGRYLRVANRRVGAGPPVRPAFGVTSPYGADVWEQTSSTSIVMLGQIEPPTRSYAGECGPPPLGNAVVDGMGHASVDCQGGCRAALVASRRGRRVQVSRTLPPHSALLVPPPTELRLPNHLVQTHLGQGAIRYVVKIDGDEAAHRIVAGG